MKKQYQLKKIKLELVVDPKPIKEQEFKEIKIKDLTKKPTLVMLFADVSADKKNIYFKPILNFFKVL